MAESFELDDGEFWLPSKFLTDDDVVTEEKKTKPLFPFDFRYGVGVSSDSSSPVESVVGSTETESDEEDLLAEITRQMARTMVDNSLNSIESTFITDSSKGWVPSGSPQSTLSPIGSGYGPDRVHSPAVNWGSVCAAAGEVARMRLNEEAFRLSSNNERGLLVSPRNPALDSLHVKSQQEALYYQKLQALQFQQLRQQQIMKQQQSLKANGYYHQQQKQVTQSQVVVHNNNNRGMRNVNKPVGLSASTWPPLVQAQQQQQQRLSGSGMRAMFLNDAVRKRECAGTGVFLPRRAGTPTETKRKQGCSTVLLPARVVQALNLDLDEVNPQRQHYQVPNFVGGFAAESGNATRAMNGRVQRPQQSSFRHEQLLPKEWAY